MRNRIILLSIVLAIWIVLKVIDDVVDGPYFLMLLGAAVAMMTAHSTWLMLAQGRWHRKNRRARMMAASNGTTTSYCPVSYDEQQWEPWVDIFIAAKNEQRVIENTVRNFFKLNYEKFDVWVIDDASTDAMPQILEQLQTEFPRLHVLRRPYGSFPGKSAALNEALPLSKAEVIAVFDADAFIEPDFLTQALPVLHAEGIGAVQVQKRIFDHQTGFLVNCQASEYAMDTYFQLGRDIIGGAVELRGNGELIKRQALIDVGGWNNKSITDDLDLSARLLINNWDIRFCPDVRVYEEGVTNLKSLLRQRRRWAEGSIQRYLDYIFPLNSPRRLSFCERLDTFAFTVYFIVPALIVLEVSSELTCLLMGVQTHCKLFALLTFLVYAVSQLNFCIAIRIYRGFSVWDSFIHSFEVTTYVYGHWIPVVTESFLRILSGKGSTWHPTVKGLDSGDLPSNQVQVMKPGS
jgi:1,2-diacylglycerol 3-beta-glucosyltransferase